MASSENKEILDLDKILLPEFWSPPKKYERYKAQLLTAPGDNYGSILFAVNITIKDTNTNMEEVIHAVAKKVPDDEFARKMFKSHLTFKKELELYRTIVPTLQEFQREQGVMDVLDIFPEFYGGRLGLTNIEEFDSHAMVLMENLKILGYENVERTLGFDLETSKLILKNLARFHAVPLALKLKKPAVFNEKIKPFLNRVNCFSGCDTSLRDEVVGDILKILEEDAVCKNHLAAIERAIKYADKCTEDNLDPVETFATITHCDFWVNNALVQFQDNKPVKNKFVDFQIIDYDSPARDLIFFLFTSVQNDVITCKYEELLMEYFHCFLETLNKLGADVAAFSFEVFEKEIERAVRQGTLVQCCMMLNPIFASEEVLEAAGGEDVSPDPSLLHKEKLWMFIKEFIKRQWI